MQLSNDFEVAAAPEQTWNLLNDIPRVVQCMPGAELTRVVSEHQWEATLRVKLGPISLRFLAEISRNEMDEATRRVLLTVKAREAEKRGSADARLTSTVAAGGTGSQVEILTDLTLRGTVAQYGRGVVPEVAAELTRQFAQCLQKQLEENTSPEAAVAQPVHGLRLALVAVWRSIRARFRR